MIDNKMNDERKFLHEIASPLSTSLFLLDSLLEKFKEQNQHESDITQMQMAFNALEKIKDLLNNRRNELIEKVSS